MKRTALIFALTLALAPLAQAQQGTGKPVGATESTPEATAAGGTGVGTISTEMAVVGLVVLGGVIAAVAGSDDDNGAVAVSTTTTTSTTTGTTTATGTGR